MPSTKPQVLVKDGRVWWFMGADYHAMAEDVAERSIRQLQRALAQLRREKKLLARAAKSTEDKA